MPSAEPEASCLPSGLNATDDTGHKVASGVYHYRLKAGEFEKALTEVDGILEKSPNSAIAFRACVATFRCVRITPFGVPVVPLV